MSKKLGILSTVAIAALSIAAMSAPAFAADTIIGLITKTNTNPFFVKMKEGAEPRPRSSASRCRPMPARRTATMTAKSRRSKN